MGKIFRRFVTVLSICLALLVIKTWYDTRPAAELFKSAMSDVSNIRVSDREGKPLSVSYLNRHNVYDNVPLHQIPEFLQEAFIISEDKRFYGHHGVDWRARASAVTQNLKGLKTVRGASTITEQVVRMLTPRKRNLWSKWLEGFEAAAIEREYSKNTILEFYLNQLPYASNRKGVVQAARYYFNRDLDTLTEKEMLALVVLVRAPSGFDLYKNPEKIEPLVSSLAKKMNVDVSNEQFVLAKPSLPVNASHFISYIRKQPISSGGNVIHSTIDSAIQQKAQAILDRRVKELSPKELFNGAALVMDSHTNEILAWVVAEPGDAEKGTADIDAVTTPRQPGSSLKPFLYAYALELGQTPATIIEDAPLSEAVGSGLHRFSNYSNVFYGNITLREALGNSLNIPALKTIQFTGVKEYLGKLHELGFESLSHDAEIYNEGLALGNGEVTLLEMVRAYSALANKGIYSPEEVIIGNPQIKKTGRVFSEEAASLAGNILSDPWARSREFGFGSVLNLPVQTAVKTGTSTDYRDSWAVGYNHRYVVGVWMGNLDGKPTNGVTGAVGPAIVLRSIFSELNRNQPTKPLYLSPKLVRMDVCIDYQDNNPCVKRTEFFIPGTKKEIVRKEARGGVQQAAIIRPTQGLQIAYDPRIPSDRQAFKFIVGGTRPGDKVVWVLNKNVIATTDNPEFLWHISRGRHSLQADIISGGKTTAAGEVSFIVK